MGYKKVEQVVVPYGQASRIAKHFGVSIQSVRNSLKYIYESDLAAAIRKEAIENYGGKKVILNEITR
jgi:hypothetical protein